jgi:hypothetical protein
MIKKERVVARKRRLLKERTVTNSQRVVGRETH